MLYSLLISPLCRGAFFTEYVEIACHEVEQILGTTPIRRDVGELTFLDITFSGELRDITRLSTIQGVFENHNGLLKPCGVAPDFCTPRSLVFGPKYPGKTNELLTQLALNLAISKSTLPAESHTLLDPMAGRGTTLLWSSRYGIDADGIELDPKALVDFQREVKKYTKLDRTKHKYSGGSLPHLKKSSDGAYSEFKFQDSTSRLIHGDSRDLTKFVGQKRRYSLIISDLPYGVQHFAVNDRSPLNVLRECAPIWVKAMKKGGSMVLAFNSFIPKRQEMVEVFQSQGLDLTPLAFEHRVSESIRRELVVFNKV